MKARIILDSYEALSFEVFPREDLPAWGRRPLVCPEIKLSLANRHHCEQTSGRTGGLVTGTPSASHVPSQRIVKYTGMSHLSQKVVPPLTAVLIWRKAALPGFAHRSIKTVHTLRAFPVAHGWAIGSCGLQV